MLLDYDFSIKYQSTNSNGQVYVLSRLINIHQNLPKDYVVAAVSAEPEIASVFTATVRVLPVTSVMIQAAKTSGPMFQKVNRYQVILTMSGQRYL